MRDKLSFEDQVKEAMKDFSLSPAEDVWTNVHRQIKQPKKRRRIIFWLFFPVLLGVLGLGTFYWGIAPSNNNIVDLGKANQPTNPEPARQQASNPAEVVTETVNNTARQPELKGGNSSNLKIAAVDPALVSTGKVNSPTHPHQIITKQGKINTTGGNSQTLHNSSIAETKAVPTYKVQQPSASPSAQNHILADTALLTFEDGTAVLKTDSSSTISTAPDATMDAAKQVDSALKQSIPVIGRTKKWKIGIEAGVGFTSQFNNPNAPTTTSITNAGTSSPLYSETRHHTLKYKPGISWTAGVTFETKITSRLTFSTGLTYNYRSTSFDQSVEMDSVGLGSSNPPTYHNNVKYSYHFIAVPLLVKGNLTNGKLASTYWIAGISNQFAINANYNQSVTRTPTPNYPRNYKEDIKSQLHPYQPMLYGGLEFRYLKLKKLNLSLVPYGELSLLPVYKTGNNSRFLGGGLKINASLK